MEKNRISKQDIELLEKIKNVTSSIESLYKKMYELEISGKQESEEFNTILGYLRIVLETENKMYQDASLTTQKSAALADYILDSLPDDFLNDNESIVNRDYSNRTLRRILNTFISKVISDYDGVKQMLPEELTEIISLLGMPNPDEVLSKSVYGGIELRKAFEKDILNGFLIFLKGFINKKGYESFKDSLIGCKYNTIFVNKSLEDDLLQSKFELSETIYMNSRLAADITQTDLEVYEALKDTHGADEAVCQISELLVMSDEDFEKNENIIVSVLRQCFMRSAFLLMGDEAIANINYQFHEFIEDKKYLDKHPDDQTGPNVVIKCFKAVKSDRSKANIISFGYRGM